MTQGTPSPERPAGPRLGEYTLERQLGPSAFLAHSAKRPEPVVVKILVSPFRARPKAGARFVCENQPLVGVRSDHLATVLEVGNAQGRSFVVREYLKGPDLGTVVQRLCALPLPQVADFGMQALEGLAMAHSLGRVHGNLRPSNVLVVPLSDGSEEIKLCDFGGPEPAERVAAGEAQAKLWAAPEQLRGEPAGPQADFYSLAALLLALLTGKLPELNEKGWPVSRLRPEAAGIDALLRRCLSPDPRGRLPDAGAMSRALAAASVVRRPGEPPPAAPVRVTALFGHKPDPTTEPVRLGPVEGASNEVVDPEGPTSPGHELSGEEKAAVGDADANETTAKVSRRAVVPAAPDETILRAETAVTELPGRPTERAPDPAERVQTAVEDTSKLLAQAKRRAKRPKKRRFSVLRFFLVLIRLFVAVVLVVGIFAGAATAVLGPKTWTEPGGLGQFVRVTASMIRIAVVAKLDSLRGRHRQPEQPPGELAEPAELAEAAAPTALPDASPGPAPPPAAALGTSPPAAK